MPDWIQIRIRALLALLLLSSLFTVDARAQSWDECFAYDSNDLLRECTFMEEWGKCLTEAIDSYYQCVDDSGEEPKEDAWSVFLNGVESLACQTALAVDNIACTLGTPLERIFKT